MFPIVSGGKRMPAILSYFGRDLWSAEPLEIHEDTVVIGVVSEVNRFRDRRCLRQGEV